MKRKRIKLHQPAEGKSSALSFRQWAKRANSKQKFMTRGMVITYQQSLAALQKKAREDHTNFSILVRFCELALKASSIDALKHEFMQATPLWIAKEKGYRAKFGNVQHPPPGALALWLKSITPRQYRLLFETFALQLKEPLVEYFATLRKQMMDARHMEKFFTLIINAKSVREIEAGIALICPSN